MGSRKKEIALQVNISTQELWEEMLSSKGLTGTKGECIGRNTGISWNSKDGRRARHHWDLNLGLQSLGNSRPLSMGLLIPILLASVICCT
ncbi:NME9 isoform 9 [Pan troglodytes]|uniref:NME/NM23 family member 9 n=2 Tax=Homininae TaxID=207598 RepID=F8WDB2_HUMAN|nr:NME/NM23 family member 9 [Homo sapiens]KAI4031759.1 NME/NM23 family member 9 [Homo sapiens]PNI96355.1 NME9 isoform 9 [Pan troglodytes]